MAEQNLRPIRIEGNFAYIPLTQGLEAIIDASDVPLVEGKSWYAKRCRRTIYAAAFSHREDGKRVYVSLHARILPCGAGLCVDHVDGNGLDCRKANLRHALPKQNASNRRLNVNNKSGFKGVSWRTWNRRWHAQIRANGKVFHLGYYKTPDEAHDAYKEASARLHGAFGRLA